MTKEYVSKHKFSDIRVPIENDNVSICRDDNVCIKCGRCKAVCTESIGVCGKYNLLKTDDTAVCINCGQCVKACPVGAIKIVEEWRLVAELIKDKNKVVIVNTAPSVRVAIGDEFGLPAGTFVQGKLVALLRKLGFKYVLDTNFGADMTIVEEASELIERLKSKQNLPQFTSCCPAWVKYVETFHPDMMANLSTCKSPIGMMGSTIKTYFASAMKLNPSDIVNVAITPCTAKKFEIRRPELNDAGNHYDNSQMRDTDYVITTRELVAWAKQEGIDFNLLEDSNYDNIMGNASGAGYIFGNSGGVMEASMRTAHYLITGKEPNTKLLNLQDVRGLRNVKEAVVKIADMELKVAVVYGTRYADELLNEIKKGNAPYDFIEVMACPGGCIGGGGQPKEDIAGLTARMNSIYNMDDNLNLRCSATNPDIVELYDNFYGKALSPKAEEMLHTSYTNRSEILTRSNYQQQEVKMSNADNARQGETKWVCKICGYEHFGASAPSECPICGVDATRFTKQ